MKEPMTVGEMIAAHHKRDAFFNRDRKWPWQTDIGRALQRFENALVRLGQVEAMEWPSDKALKACSDRVEQARDEIHTLLFFQLCEDKRDAAKRSYLVNEQMRTYGITDD